MGEWSIGLKAALGIGDRRQRLVFDLDQLGGIASERGALGDDRGDGNARRVDDGARQVRAPDVLQPGQHRHEGQGTQRSEVAGRDDPEHARGAASRVGPERDHPGVGVRAPEKCQVREPGHLDVVDVLPATRDELRIFRAPERSTDIRLAVAFAHGPQPAIVWLSSPTPTIQSFTVSPAFRNVRRGIPTPAGVPVRMRSPG